jgi:hypothetical protein
MAANLRSSVEFRPRQPGTRATLTFQL